MQRFKAHIKGLTQFGDRMQGTQRNRDAISWLEKQLMREAERITGIIRGSNPHHHEPTDKYESYSEEDFVFGFNSAQTTLGALGSLAGISVVRGR